MIRPPLREFKIRLVIADTVGVPFDPHSQVGSFAKRRGNLFQNIRRLRCRDIAVGPETDFWCKDPILRQIDLDRGGSPGP